MSEIEKSSYEDLSVFDAEKTNQTGQTEFKVDKSVRDTQIVKVGQQAFDSIIQLYQHAVHKVINPFYGFKIRDSEMPQVLRYEPGGFYQPHIDGQSLWNTPEGPIWRKSTDRDLSTVFYLNDDFEGGDFVFPELRVRIKPEPGMLIAFPSSWQYVHGVEPVTKGIRYAIVNWLTIQGLPTMDEETKEINKKYGLNEGKPNGKIH